VIQQRRSPSVSHGRVNDGVDHLTTIIGATEPFAIALVIAVTVLDDDDRLPTRIRAPPDRGISSPTRIPTTVVSTIIVVVSAILSSILDPIRHIPAISIAVI